MANSFTIHWSSWLQSGNPRVNRSPQDNYSILCGGFTKILAETEDAAAKIFSTCFPSDKIIRIEK